MKFEEEFPSLKGRVEYWIKEHSNGSGYEIKSLIEQDIQKHCIDKQRAREALEIKSVFNRGGGVKSNHEEITIENRVKFKILKELGLEE